MILYFLKNTSTTVKCLIFKLNEQFTYIQLNNMLQFVSILQYCFYCCCVSTCDKQQLNTVTEPLPAADCSLSQWEVTRSGVSWFLRFRFWDHADRSGHRFGSLQVLGGAGVRSLVHISHFIHQEDRLRLLPGCSTTNRADALLRVQRPSNLQAEINTCSVKMLGGFNVNALQSIGWMPLTNNKLAKAHSQV